MKLTINYLSEISRSKAAGRHFWTEVDRNFIDSYREEDALLLEGTTHEDIRESRGTMVKRCAYYELVEPCTQFLFHKTAQNLAEKIDIDKIPLEAFREVSLKAGKIVTAEQEFYMWYKNPDPNYEQITISKYWIEPDSAGDAFMFAFSTIDFNFEGTGEAKMRTNPWDKYNTELDRKMTQFLFYLFMAEGVEQVEIQPGRNNGKTKKQGKVVNEWTSPVIHVTSSWSSEYVGVVSGHWRHQPYGPREQPRHKLIWIKPFQKKYSGGKTKIE